VFQGRDSYTEIPPIPKGILGRRAKLDYEPRVSKIMKPRTCYRLGGLSSPLAFGFANATYGNLLRAVIMRLALLFKEGAYKAVPKPVPHVFGELQHAKRKLSQCLFYVPKYTKLQFLNCYTGRKRTLYEIACDSLVLRGLQTKDAITKFFLKCETKAYTLLKPDAVDRVISPRGPRYGFSVGVFLKPMEHVIFKAMQKAYSQSGLPVVIKGYNALKSGRILALKWARFVDPVCILFDAERFDQHTSYDALVWEHSVYMSLCPPADRAELKRLLDMQLRNFGVAYLPDGVIKYKLEGVRMSGDMNTSLGNCLIMTTLVYDFLVKRGISKYEIHNNGDDCLIIVERDQAPIIQDHLFDHVLRFGYTLVVEQAVEVFEQIDFCQTHPVWTPDGYVMVRSPEKATAKDCMTTLDLSTSLKARQYCRAIGDCGAALSSGIPVMQEYYQALRRNARARWSEIVTEVWQYMTRIMRRRTTLKKVGNRILGLSGMVNSTSWDRGMTRLSKGMTARYVEIHPRTRHSFALAFGIEPCRQLQLESAYAQLTLDLSTTTSGKFSNFCRGWGDWPNDPWADRIAI